MATKKAGSPKAAPAAAPAAGKRKREPSSATEASRSAAPDTRQMMREAAWRQMFGRAQAKNPFGR